jgi:hypothetical protein
VRRPRTAYKPGVSQAASLRGLRSREPRAHTIIENYREIVRGLGKIADVCTYGYLAEVCEDCRCGRADR